MLPASTASIEEAISLSKFTQSSGSTSPASSVTKLANPSSSSWSILSLNTKTKLKKTVGDCLIRDFFSRSFNPRNRFQYINFFNNFRGFSIIINPGKYPLVFNLKFFIIPAPRGCSLDVMFLGKKSTLIFEYETTKFSG